MHIYISLSRINRSTQHTSCIYLDGIIISNVYIRLINYLICALLYNIFFVILTFKFAIRHSKTYLVAPFVDCLLLLYSVIFLLQTPCRNMHKKSQGFTMSNLYFDKGIYDINVIFCKHSSGQLQTHKSLANHKSVQCTTYINMI